MQILLNIFLYYVSGCVATILFMKFGNIIFFKAHDYVAFDDDDVKSCFLSWIALIIMVFCFILDLVPFLFQKYKKVYEKIYGKIVKVLANFIKP